VALVASHPSRAAAQAANDQATAALLQTGGLAPVTLKRVATRNGATPEFLSRTFLTLPPQNS